MVAQPNDTGGLRAPRVGGLEQGIHRAISPCSQRLDGESGIQGDLGLRGGPRIQREPGRFRGDPELWRVGGLGLCLCICLSIPLYVYQSVSAPHTPAGADWGAWRAVSVRTGATRTPVACPQLSSRCHGNQPESGTRIPTVEQPPWARAGGVGPWMPYIL